MTLSSYLLVLNFDGVNTFSGTFDYVCDIGNLIATYDFIGDTVKVGNAIQTKSVSKNDFSTTVEYVLSNSSDNNSKSYYIKISYAVDLPVEITSFSFLTEFNPTLIQDVTLTFDGVDTYSGTLNYLCDIDNLVASFNFEGSSVKVKNIEQTTGVSSNDFNKVLNYVVHNSSSLESKNYYIEISYFTGLPRILINK